MVTFTIKNHLVPAISNRLRQIYDCTQLELSRPIPFYGTTYISNAIHLKIKL